MIKRIVNLYGKLKLLPQIFIVTFLIIIFMAVVGVVIFSYFLNIYNEMLTEQLSSNLELSIKSMGDELDKIEDISTALMTDSDFQSKLSTLLDNNKNYDDFTAMNDINQILTKKMNESKIINSITVLNLNYAPVITMNIKWTKEKTNIITRRVSPDSKKHIWIEPNDSINDLFSVRNIVNVSTSELRNMGILIIGIDVEKIVNKKYLDFSNYELGSLVMSDDIVIYSDLYNKADSNIMMHEILSSEKKQNIIKVGNEKYFSVIKPLAYEKWSYVVYCKYADVFGRVNKNISIIFIVFLAFVFFIIVGSYLLSKKILNPVLNLSNQMKTINNGIFEGVILAADREDSNNEIDLLAQDFNLMIETINTLINQNYLKKISLQETELKLLQSQINPHFLYNTLESINWMVISGRKDEASNVVYILGKLLRNTINNIDMFISIKEELEFLNDYIYIQKIRYEERLEVDINVDPIFYDCKIPKLLLQPLIENSIKYSLEEYIQVCEIKIKAVLDSNSVKIIISDNGPGINDEQLSKISQNQPLDSPSGIALKNIQKRLLLAFGDENALEIKSIINKGTTITITLPYKDY